MADQPAPRSPHFTPVDPGRVDTMNPVEVQYWCGEFQCTEGALMDAVARVGDHVAALREQLPPRSAPRA